MSGLPDDLRAAIISLLPVEEAVRSSLLSRAWRDVWTGMSRLDLRSKKKRYYESHNTHPSTRLLLESMPRLNLAGIRTLCLSDVGPLEPPRPLRKRKWRRDSGWRADDTEQRGLFGEFLEVLELSRCNFAPSAGIPFERCTNLKSLKLCGVRIGAHVLDSQLFPNCSLLETLSLSSSVIRGVAHLTACSASRSVARFSANSRLKSLDLHTVRLTGVTQVSIEAPGLTNLTLDHLSVSNFGFDMSKFSFALDAPEIVALQVRGSGTALEGQSPRYRKDHYLTSAYVLELFTRRENIGNDHKAGVDSRFQRLQSLSTDLDLKDTTNAALLCRFLKLCHQSKRLYITTYANKEEKQGTSSDQYRCHSHLPVPWIIYANRSI